MLKLTKVPAFGFQNSYSLVPGQSADSVLVNNVRKIVGYLPGLGLIQGIEHIVRAVNEKSEYSPHYIWRGILEFFGLGFLLLIPDLIITAVQQQKAVQVSLAGRKIVPVTVPATPAPQTAVFSAPIAAFIASPPTSPTSNLIELRKRLLSDIQNGHEKVKRRLKQFPVHPWEKEEIKSIIADTAKLSYGTTETLINKMLNKGILTFSPEDVAFYTEVGKALAKRGKGVKGGLEFITFLNLDLTKPYCLAALKSMAMTYAQYSPLSIIYEREALNLNMDNPAEAQVFLDILCEGARHNPSGVLQFCKDEHYPENEIAKIEEHAWVQGTLEERRKQAFHFLQTAPWTALDNLDYCQFDTSKPEEFPVVCELLVAMAKANVKITPKITEKYGLTMDKPEGFPYLMQIATLLVRNDGEELITLPDYGFNFSLPQHKAFFQSLVEYKLLLAPENTMAIIEGENLQDWMADFPKLLDFAKNFKNSPLTLRLKIFDDIINYDGALAAESIDFYFDASKSDELAAIKDIASRYTDCSHFRTIKLSMQDRKEILLNSAEEVDCYPEFMRNLKAVVTDDDPQFRAEIAFKLSACTTKIVKDLAKFNLDPSKDTLILKEIALRVAKQDGSVIKKQMDSFGFDPLKHADIIEEIMQAAIAEDGPEPIKPAKSRSYAPMTFEHFKQAFLDSPTACFLPTHRYIYKKFQPQVGQHKDALKQFLIDFAPNTEISFKLMTKFLKDKLINDDPSFCQELAFKIASHDTTKATLIQGWYSLSTDFPDLLKFQSLLPCYAQKYGIDLVKELAPFSSKISHNMLKQLGEQSLKHNPKLTIKNANFFKLNYESPYAEAWKPGNLAERIADAKEEITHYTYHGPGLFDNFIYYHFDINTREEYHALVELVVYAFKTKPKEACKGLNELTDILSPHKSQFLSEVFLKAALTGSQELFMLIYREQGSALGSVFLKNFLKIYAASNTNLVCEYIGGFDELDDDALLEILNIALENDQKKTLSHLRDFGISAEEFDEAKKVILRQVKVTGSLVEREQKALNALQKSVSTVFNNIEFYFDASVPEEQTVIKKVVVEGLKKCSYFHPLPAIFTAQEQEELWLQAAPFITSDRLLQNLRVNSKATFNQIVSLLRPNIVIHNWQSLKLDLTQSNDLQLFVKAAKQAVQDNPAKIQFCFAPLSEYAPLQFAAMQEILRAHAQHHGKLYTDKLKVNFKSYHGIKLKKCLYIQPKSSSKHINK